MSASNSQFGNAMNSSTENSFLAPSDDILFFNSSNINSSSINSSVNNNSTFYNNNTTDAFGNFTAANHGEKDADPIMWVWPFLLIVVLCCSTRSTIPDASHRTALIERTLRRERELAGKLDPERRKRVVAASLITKRVIACDANKTLRLGEVSGSVSLEESSFSLNSIEDENVSQCVICLDSFQRGDYVTWSKHSVECRHVFHEECLEEWLIDSKHDDCPSCRCQIIEDDGVAEICDDDEMDEVSSTRLAVVIMNGLISPLRRARNSMIGSSINVNADDDDDLMIDESNGSLSSISLRRVFSTGGGDPERRPSMLGVALRRVSSGIYSHINGDAQDDADSDSEERPASLREPHELRRTRSEGLPTTPRISNNSNSAYLVLGESNSSTDLDSMNLDLELDGSNSSDYDHGGAASAIMRLGFRRRGQQQQYAKVAFEPDGGSFVEEFSDEDSLEPNILWRDEVDDEGDVEMGSLQTPPPTSR